MKQFFTAAAMAVACLSFAAPAQADEATVRKALNSLEGMPTAGAIRKAPMPGWWEVQVGNDILYASDNGEFLVKGEVLRIPDKRNLTYERQEEINRIDFESLPLQSAIVRKIGTGKSRIAIFEDPNCGYCKQLERQLGDLKDVTIYTFLVPILGPDSITKSRDLWCSKDQLQAWQDWMNNGKRPETSASTCKDPLAANMAFASARNISSTPTLIFQDGKRVLGAISPAEIRAKIQRAEQRTAPKKN